MVAGDPLNQRMVRCVVISPCRPVAWVWRAVAARDLEPRHGIFLSFVSYFKATDWFLVVFPRWALSEQGLDSS